MVSRLVLMSALGLSVTALSACSIASGYSEAEREVVETLTPSKYQPATQQMRANIETQDLLAQAAFWSREYQLNPADLEAAVKLASAVRRMGNPSKALEITQTSRAMFPSDPYLMAEHSASLIALERGSEALKPLDTAIHAAPNYARLWSLKGAALDQTGQYDVARKHYEKGLKLSPHDPNIMANMGLSFALAGDPATAEKWLKQAAFHPDASAGIKQNYDLVLQLQGKPVQFGRSAPAPAPRQRQAPVVQRQQMPIPNSNARTRAMPVSAPAIGHRSNMTVVGQQAGAPSSSAEMFRRVAAQQPSSNNRVVVPYQADNAAPADITDLISKSLNGKKEAALRPAMPNNAHNVPVSARQSNQMVQGSAYPNPYAQVPTQMYPAQPQAVPAPRSYQAPTERRGAARRR